MSVLFLTVTPVAGREIAPAISTLTNAGGVTGVARIRLRHPADFDIEVVQSQPETRLAFGRSTVELPAQRAAGGSGCIVLMGQ